MAMAKSAATVFTILALFGSAAMEAEYTGDIMVTAAAPGGAASATPASSPSLSAAGPTSKMDSSSSSSSSSASSPTFSTTSPTASSFDAQSLYASNTHWLVSGAVAFWLAGFGF